MLMMLFQQLQLYQQQSDNQYAQMNMGQEMANIQDQTSIFEQHLGSVEDATSLGYTTAMQASNVALFGPAQALGKELEELRKIDPQTPEILEKLEKKQQEYDSKMKEAYQRQNTMQLSMTNMHSVAKRIFQGTRDAMMAPLKMKEKRMQVQLKTLEAQGTFIDKRLERVEKQLESSIKEMTPGFGVGQG